MSTSIRVLLSAAILAVPDASAVEIVSNLNETYNFGAGLGGVFVEASSFTTGAQAYKLNSITLDLQVNSIGTVAVTLVSDAAGLPGTAVESLTAQAVGAVGESNVVFPASGATTLVPFTRYWVVVEQVGAGSIQWVSTYSTAETSLGGVTIGNDMYYRNVGGTTWTPQSPATDAGQFAVDATVPPAATPYDLVGWYLESGSTGALQSIVYKAGAAQGCPNYGGPPPDLYVQPCYNPAHSWTATNGVVNAVSTAGPPAWSWNGVTLSETGLFWATYFLNSNPNGFMWWSFNVANLSITPGAPGATTFGNYQCFDGSGVGLCPGAEIVFNMWNVVRDDGMYLILSTTPSVGSCFLYGAGPTSGCPNESPPVARFYMVLAAQSAPDTDGDDTPDGVDNCSQRTNGDQFDGDSDGYGNPCDGDLNNSSVTNAQDYAIFRSKLGSADATADLNHNGTVNAQDYAIFRSLLGMPLGPSGLHP